MESNRDNIYCPLCLSSKLKLENVLDFATIVRAYKKSFGVELESSAVDKIYIYDDCSTDNTVVICKAHPAVKKVIQGTHWANTTQGRNIAEGTLRQIVYNEAIKWAVDVQWFVDVHNPNEFDYDDYNGQILNPIGLF